MADESRHFIAASSNQSCVVEPTENMLEENKEIENVKDKYFLIYFLFYAMGTLTQLSSNFFTTATDYWMYKFRNLNNDSYTSSDNRTELQAAFIANYNIVINVSNVIFLIVTVVFLRKLMSVLKRVVGALIGILVLFVVTVVLAEVDTDSWQFGFYVTTLVLGFVITAFSATFMVTVFQLVAKFPPSYLGATLSGQSICGILAALIQIFSLGVGTSSLMNGLIYFLIGAFCALVTILSFMLAATRSEFFKYNQNRMIQTDQTQKFTLEKSVALAVLNKIKIYIIAMIVVLGTTIIVHPGLASLVVSVDEGNGNKWNDTFFVPVVTFLFFNLFEYVGRETVNLIKKPSNAYIILAISLCRMVFIPLIMLSNAQPRANIEVVFDQDYAYIIFIIILALTNGYLVNLCVMHISLRTTEAERNVALGLMMIFMIVSLAICSFLSPIVIDAL